MDSLTGYPQHVALYEQKKNPADFARFSYELTQVLDPNAPATESAYSLKQADFQDGDFDQYIFAKYYLLDNCRPSLETSTIITLLYAGLTDEYQAEIQPKLTTIRTFQDLV